MERKQRQKLLLNDKCVDPLTQLWNQEYMKRCMQDYFKGFDNAHWSAILVLNLDSFKKVNDIYGHLQGDWALIRTASVLKELFSEDDVIARTGADEFSIFLKDIKSEAELSEKCKDTCWKIKDCFASDFLNISLTCSIGAILIQNMGADYDQLIQRANVALYQAKFNGKNTYHIESKKLESKRMKGIENLDVPERVKSKITAYTQYEENSFGSEECSFDQRVHTFYYMSIIALLFMALLIWSVSVAGTYYINRDFYEKSLQQQAKITMYQNSQSIKTYGKQVVYVSDNAMIKELLRETTSEMQRKELQSKIKESILNSMEKLDVFWGVQIDGIHTSLYLSNNEMPILKDSISKFPEISRMKFNEEGFSVNLCEFNKKAVLMLTCPVKENHKEVLGYVHVFFNEGLLRLPEPEKDCNGMFLDAVSWRAFYENDDRTLEAAGKKLGNSEGLLKAVQANLESGKLFDFIADNGTPMIGVVSQDPNYPLAFVAAIEKRKMTQMVYQYTFYQNLMNLVLLCLFALLMYFIYNHTNKPVNVMIEQCRRMAEGDHSIVFEMQDDKDLNLLAATFNRYRERVEAAAYLDSLLQIGNRAKCTNDLSVLISSSETRELSIFMIDIKEFSKYNDLFSIKVGDEILKNVFRRLAYIFNETLYRMNGDVFLGININSKEDRDTLEKIRSSLEPVMLIHDTEFHLQYNVGICHFPVHGSNVSELLERAQSALNYAKKQPIANAVVYNEKITDILRREDEILALIRRRIADRSLEVWYQPIYDSVSGRFTTAEALLRLKDEQGSYISSQRAILIAEKNNETAAIAEYVLEESCDMINALHDMNCSISAIYINLSVQQIMQKNYAESVLSLIRKKGVEPNQIGIEVTETMLIQSFHQAIDVLTQLRKEGVHISMDDFGSGYSSINYLAQLPIDKLKLDRDLVMQVNQNEEQFSFIKTVIQMAKIKKMKVIAEGVEEKGTFDRIVACGADYVQGHYFSKALRRKEFIAFLEQHK